jgi:uncharacterized protein DUF6361
MRFALASTFTWLDYSEHDRRQMLDAIKRLGERQTRDELGLGGVRDAFADQLFPGTSTIQTRAKYFLLVPWAYRTLELRRVPSAAMPNRARRLEADVMRVVGEWDDATGLIGRRARENLQRLPSSVYWQGLLVWGIRVFAGSQEEYHQSLDHWYGHQNAHGRRRDDYDDDSAGVAVGHNWHTGLPRTPDPFPVGITLRLTRAEAEYLRERVLTSCPTSLLANALQAELAVDADHAWDLVGNVTSSLREVLGHARNFSEVMLGAQLLYNLMIAELRGSRERVEEYQQLLEEWWELLAKRHDELQRWDRLRFWNIVYRGNPRVSRRAKLFVTRWTDIVRQGERLQDIVENRNVRGLIETRETQLKGGLSRLTGSRAKEQQWSGAAGAGQLDFRWPSARRIIMDIFEGLREGKDA